MSSQDVNYGGDNVNEGGKSDSTEGFPFVENNLYSDAYLHPQESKSEQVESTSERAGATVNPVANWEGNARAQQVSCQAYCRDVNPSTPSQVDQAGYFGGGPVAERQLTAREQYQRNAQLAQQENAWNRNNYVDRSNSWDQRNGYPGQGGNEGQTIVSISKGGGQNNPYGGGYNNGWGNQGGWNNQGNQGGDSTTIVTSGGQDVSTGRDNIRLGEYEYDKSRTQVGNRVINGQGNQVPMDSQDGTYNDNSARQLGRFEALNRVLGTVADHRDSRNGGDIYSGNDPYAARRNREYQDYYNGGTGQRPGRNTTIITQGGNGQVFTGSDNIRLGEFEYGKDRTHVGTPPFIPQNQGQRGPSYNGNGGMDNRNGTFNDQTARELGTYEAGNRILGNVLRIFDK